MKINNDFQLKKIGSQHMIVVANADSLNLTNIYSLNDTAAWLWETASALGEFSQKDLVDALCQEYEVGEDTASVDVAAIIDQWNEAGFIIE